jgi:transposase
MVDVINPSDGKPSISKSIRNFATVTGVGLDLAKRVFQVHAVDANGKVVVARKLARGRLVGFFSELPPWRWKRAHRHIIGGGDCCARLRSEADPARACEALCPRNKNDAVDVAAICEAAGRPGQRFGRCGRSKTRPR